MKTMEELPIDKLQARFFELCKAKLSRLKIGANLERAFLAVHRHHFVRHYRLRGGTEWHTVTDDNLLEHLPVIYQDQTLTLTGKQDADVTSTISVPSFVLLMLHLLDLRPGQKVFEIGTGSGFAAALMAKAVEPGGRVYSSEIIPEIASDAELALHRAGIENVVVIPDDGGDGFASGGPYDRIIFTAGAYDLPRAHIEQLKENGLILFVLKNRVGGDSTLLLLEKANGRLVCRYAFPCGFVGFTGKYAGEELDPVPLDSLPDYQRIAALQVSKRPFWWSDNRNPAASSVLATLQAFLDLAYPNYQPLTDSASVDTYGEQSFFGFWSSDRSSIAIVKGGFMTTYGNAKAESELLAAIETWVKHGMPALHNLLLSVYPSDVTVPPDARVTWVCRRKESTFYWRLRDEY
jgi:protein-L-isoaspartate(D-aspartate) O-methyltransferase